eukprot:11741940-Alexandrium_andersonii.AAC.1
MHRGKPLGLTSYSKSGFGLAPKAEQSSTCTPARRTNARAVHKHERRRARARTHVPLAQPGRPRRTPR